MSKLRCVTSIAPITPASELIPAPEAQPAGIGLLDLHKHVAILLFLPPEDRNFSVVKQARFSQLSLGTFDGYAVELSARI